MPENKTRMVLRQADVSDAAAIRAVYEPYLATPVTFEYECPSVAEFERRIEKTLRAYPYFVLCENERVLAYAYAGRFQPRPAYDWGAELSVYVAPEAVGRGLGRRLYAALIQVLRVQNIRTVYGCIALPNPGSTAFHEALGFTCVARFAHAGFKNGAWHDTVWYEKVIADPAFDSRTPSPVIPCSECRHVWLPLLSNQGENV